MQHTAIEWATHTFNPWRGCAKISPGCANCYADRQAKRNPTVLGKWGPNGNRVIAGDAYWTQPLKWNAAAACLGTFDCANGDHADCCPQANRPRVFCASMADVFEDRPELEAPRERLFDLIYQTKNLDWLLLTKRPENVIPMVGGDSGAGAAELLPGGVFDNVWLGTSVEDQQRADERIPRLLNCPAAVRFLSCEPLLGPVDLTQIWNGAAFHRFNSLARWTDGRGTTGVDWVIVGGESGHGARPMHPNWATAIRDQCVAAGVPFFFKQWGEWKPYREMQEIEAELLYKPLREDQHPDLHRRVCRVKTTSLLTRPLPVGGELHQFFLVGKKAAGRALDGREWNEVPQSRREVAC